MGLETAAIVGIGTALASVAASVIPAAIAKPPKAPAPTLLGPDQAEINKQLAASEAKTKSQAAAANGKASTILTSPLGAADNANQPASLLGQ